MAKKPDLPTLLYRVYDTLDGTYWYPNSGKTFWNSAGAAKNAWNFNSATPFSQQHRYVVHEFQCSGWALSANVTNQEPLLI